MARLWRKEGQDVSRAGQPSACPSCGSALAAGQGWCFECGNAVPGRLGAGPRWRTLGALAAMTLLLLGGAVVASYAAVSSEPAAPQPTVIAQAPPVVPAPVPVTPTTPPATGTTPTVPTPRPKRNAPAQTVPDPAPSATTGDPAPAPAPAPSSTPTPPSTTPPAADPLPGTGGEEDEGDAATPASGLIELEGDDLALYDPQERPGAEFGAPDAAADGDPETVWDVVVPADGEDVRAGLVIDLGERRRVLSLTVRTTTPGFDARVYVARQGVPATLADWERVAVARDIPREREIALDVEGRVRRLLLWITDAGDEEDPRVAIGEVEVEAG